MSQEILDKIYAVPRKPEILSHPVTYPKPKTVISSRGVGELVTNRVNVFLSKIRLKVNMTLNMFYS